MKYTIEYMDMYGNWSQGWRGHHDTLSHAHFQGRRHVQCSNRVCYRIRQERTTDESAPWYLDDEMFTAWYNDKGKDSWANATPRK